MSRQFISCAVIAMGLLLGLANSAMAKGSGEAQLSAAEQREQKAAAKIFMYVEKNFGQHREFGSLSSGSKYSFMIAKVTRQGTLPISAAEAIGRNAAQKPVFLVPVETPYRVLRKEWVPRVSDGEGGYMGGYYKDINGYTGDNVDTNSAIKVKTAKDVTNWWRSSGRGQIQRNPGPGFRVPKFNPHSLGARIGQVFGR